MQTDELATWRRRREAAGIAGRLIASAESLLRTFREEPPDDFAAVCRLAFIRNALCDSRAWLRSLQEGEGNAAEREGLGELIDREMDLEARLRAIDLEDRIVDAALDEMIARALTVLGEEAPVVTLLRSAWEVDYPPVRMAAIEAVYALDDEVCDAIEGALGE